MNKISAFLVSVGHWTGESWPKREGFEIGEKNIIHSLLINPNKVLLPPLHVSKYENSS